MFLSKMFLHLKSKLQIRETQTPYRLCIKNVKKMKYFYCFYFLIKKYKNKVLLFMIDLNEERNKLINKNRKGINISFDYLNGLQIRNRSSARNQFHWSILGK